MEWIGSCVFLPLTFVVLLSAFNGRLCQRLRRSRVIAVLEKKLEDADRCYWLWFALCMLLGVFSRCYRFVELPLGINQDGLMAGTEAYSLMMNGTDQYGTSWPTYFRAWDYAQMSTPYSILMIPFIHIFGLNKLSLRLPMLLVSAPAREAIWSYFMAYKPLSACGNSWFYDITKQG